MNGNASSENAVFSELVAIMARLRSPSGCPWDREQDHRSLRPSLLEETYEVLEAIDRGDSRALCQELGDLLLQVVFHAQLAAEAREFDIGDVVRGIRDKLIGRHPHVFGQASAETPEEVLDQWDRLKRDERGGGGADVVTGVPATLPALARAQVVQRRAARAGRGAGDAGEAARAALGALAAGGLEAEKAQQAVGELLLAVVALAQAAGVEAEQALRERVDRLVNESAAGGVNTAGASPHMRTRSVDGS
ncbi:MAG: nucleoside triphosphate pyrophosphohydrolase [Armatimonadota bacterium]